MLVALSRWRIELGFLLGVVALVTARPTPVSIAAGMSFVLAGVGLRAWARGHLARRSHLTRSGPYAFIRHPLYVGSFLLGLGFALMTGNALVPSCFAIVFVVMYVPKALREEAFLRERYGEEYDVYMRSVGACVPKRGTIASAPSSRQPFSWQRLFGHREHLTWLGTAMALTLVWAEAIGALHAVAQVALHRLPWLGRMIH